jgi:hypothetical protein
MKKTILAAVALLTMSLTTAAFAGGRHGGGFKHLDVNKDGKVTRTEMEQSLKARFAKLDTNKDGFVTKEEMKAGHPARKNKKAADKSKRKGHGKRGEKHFAKLDTNKDGKLSSQEFLASAGHFFKHFDTNKDGVVTKDEMKAARKNHKGHRKTQPA